MPTPPLPVEKYDFNQLSPSSSSRIPVDFSPPLIAMVVTVITAFVIVTYFRLISRHLIPPIIHLLRKWRIRWRLYRRRRSTGGEDIESSPFSPPSDSSAAFHYLSTYGVDDSLIKTIPLSIYGSAKTKTKTKSTTILDCAVCLVEFEESDYIRTLPICSHSFHVDCIDIWLRSHANCPLCRGGIFASSPLMASSRIRPSFEDIDILQSILSESRNYENPNSNSSVCEIRNDSFDPTITNDFNTTTTTDNSNHNHRNFLLKRSYSFGFERNLLPSSDNHRLLTETATASSPWRRSFWSKRTTTTSSPFTVSSKSRVFSLRYYNRGGGGIKSPFFRRCRGGSSSSLFPLSESSNFRYGGGYSSRRSKSMTSPLFMASSRLRCGDPEALLSPERLSRR